MEQRVCHKTEIEIDDKHCENGKYADQSVWPSNNDSLRGYQVAWKSNEDVIDMNKKKKKWLLDKHGNHLKHGRTYQR